MVLDRESMPYRPCAGIALFNAQGQVFLGERAPFPYADEGDRQHPWQMPQGGIDKGEDPQVAAIRELAEETSVVSAKLIGAVDDWIPYDLPDAVLGIGLKGKYRGQKQMWYALLFTGDESEINVTNPMKGEHPSEFKSYRWAELSQIADLVVPFKRDVYTQVASQFADLPKRIRSGEFS